MCFTEGCPNKVNMPFQNAEGKATPAKNEHQNHPKLSKQGYLALHGKSLGDFIKPPEEVFICLTLAKYLLYKLKNDLGPPKNYLDGEPSSFPVSPWKEQSNQGYEQIDLDFFFHHCRRVVDIHKEDLSKDVKERWVCFDYQDEIGVVAPRPTAPGGANPNSNTNGDQTTNSQRVLSNCAPCWDCD